ncbi:hypothetical protein ACFL0Q_09015 [Thermodesulfobacteriota bacterium]
MQFIKPDINLDFVGKRKIAFGFSFVVILLSVLSLIIHGGPRYGVDFAGGVLLQLKFGSFTTPATAPLSTHLNSKRPEM